uniref:Uncharacterized protein n=1 Tax=viral metagenome TaxID=1070528 RepID=A0A6M3L689_9ZZZZ
MEALAILLILGIVIAVASRRKGKMTPWGDYRIVKLGMSIQLKEGPNFIVYDGPSLYLPEALSNICPTGEDVVSIVWAREIDAPDTPKENWPYSIQFHGLRTGNLANLQRGLLYNIVVTRDIIWNLPDSTLYPE